MQAIRVLLLALLTASSFAQKTSVGGMDISWQFEEDQVRFTVTAPDDGWVALGFNDKDDILGTNLIMVAVEENTTSSEEFYVVGLGNPQPVTELGSTNQHTGVSGYEHNGTTTVSFSMATNKVDNKHYELKKGETIWLICAFSMEDDFDHHSRMRRHVKVTL